MKTDRELLLTITREAPKEEIKEASEEWHRRERDAYADNADAVDLLMECDEL